jgi:hypothetical protein
MFKKNIAIHQNRKALSGLLFFENLITSLNLVGVMGTLLPAPFRKSNIAAKNKFITGIYSFIAGADCMEDIDSLRSDPMFAKLTNDGIASTTMGRFIRNTPLKYIQRLENYLPTLALELRRRLHPKETDLIISMDSTPHVQRGLQMEGVAWNYKNLWCLDSQNAFDQYELCYGWHLRAGNTFSANGAEEMIDKIFSKVPKFYKRFFRADSAYANMKVYNALLIKNVQFAICLRENSWEPLLANNSHRMKWEKTRIRFFESNKCQIASTLYPLKGLIGRSFLRVVYIRAPKKKKKTEKDKRTFDYYAIVTNISEFDKSNEEIIEFYRKRANVENQIKDLKYGMDFLHFPSGKLNANRMWGLMGIFAYNLMRYASFTVSKQGCFLKRVRMKMVYIAARVVDHNRKLHIHFNNRSFKEVQQLLEKLQNHQVVDYDGQKEINSSA